MGIIPPLAVSVYNFYKGNGWIMNTVLAFICGALMILGVNSRGCPDPQTLLFDSIDCLAILEHIDYSYHETACKSMVATRDCYKLLMGSCSKAELIQHDLWDSYDGIMETVRVMCEA